MLQVVQRSAQFEWVLVTLEPFSDSVVIGLNRLDSDIRCGLFLVNREDLLLDVIYRLLDGFHCGRGHIGVGCSVYVVVRLDSRVGSVSPGQQGERVESGV